MRLYQWVTQLRIRNIYLFIYMFSCLHIILYFDPHIFVFALWSTPSPYSTKQHPLVYRSLPAPSKDYCFELGFPWHEWSFVEAVRSYKLTGVHFKLDLVVVVSYLGYGAVCHAYMSCTTVLFFWKSTKVSLELLRLVNKCVCEVIVGYSCCIDKE